MAETVVSNGKAEYEARFEQDVVTPSAPSNASSSDGFPFSRVEFHMARKSFTGFSYGGGNFHLETLNPTASSTQDRSWSSGSSGLGLKNREISEGLESGLDPELSFGITFKRIGAGLENLGNTCFLNSVLQCLTYTEPLAAYLQSGKHQVSCRKAGFCALCAIQKHVSRALHSTGRILAPKDLVSNLRCISRNFRNSRQEDAHEYMVNLLESMHRCCLPCGVPSESPSAYEKSLVHKIFGGRLRSQVKCMQCSFCSNKFDPFLDLSLEIVKADSLFKAFANFTAKEQLDGGERQYQCQQCQQKVKALKQLTIHKAPYVLTIHLKRFGSHISGQKIDKKIQFGPTLDLKPFVTGPYDGDLKYTLYGVLVHAGWSTHSGHYYCFVRTSSGMWYSLDDNQVVQVSERKVFEQKAYMLFYFRDRKHLASKKCVDVMTKENMVINGLGRSKTFSGFSDAIKDCIVGSTAEKTLKLPNSSPTVDDRDASNADFSKERASIQEMHVSCDNVSLLESSLKVLPPSGLVIEPSVLQQNGSVEGSGDCPELRMQISLGAEFVKCSEESGCMKDPCKCAAFSSSFNASGNSVVGKENGKAVSVLPNCDKNRSSSEDFCDSVARPTDCIDFLKSPGDACIMEKKSRKVNVASSSDPCCTTLERSDPLASSGLTNHDILIDKFPHNQDGGVSLCEGSGIYGRRLVDTVPAELSSLPNGQNLSLKVGVKKTRKKIKKKLLQCWVTRLHLGLNVLVGSPLSVRKKIKQKQSKKRTLYIGNLGEHLSNGNCISAELGPSSSDVLKGPSNVGVAHSHLTEVKPASKSVGKAGTMETAVSSSNGDLFLNAIENEFRERSDKNAAVLATVDGLKPTSIGDLDGQGLDSTMQKISKGGERDPKQKSLMDMLTRGLEEQTIARWDGIKSFSCRSPVSTVTESISIGYVGDEWDEEYDRGKRKKVRKSNSRFDGQNPFQEVAAKKAKLSKVRYDRSSSGNRPFRI